MPNHLTRRQFLQSLVISLSVPPLLGACLDLNYDRLARKLMRNLARKDLANKVGKAYIKYIEPGHQLDKALIVESILADLPISGNDLKSIKPGLLKEILHQRITLDFTDEKVLPVVGWLLSETETKICLLVYATDVARQS